MTRRILCLMFQWFILLHIQNMTVTIPLLTTVSPIANPLLNMKIAKNIFTDTKRASSQHDSICHVCSFRCKHEH